MFVIFVAIASIVAHIDVAIRNHIEDNRFRALAERDGLDWWYDYRRNCRVRMSNGERYNLRTINGDLCEVDRNGKILKNISCEKRLQIAEQSKERAKQTGSRYYMIDAVQISRHYKDGYYGEHWQNMDNGQIYVKRYVYGRDVIGWMNTSTGLYEELIDNGNEKQMERARAMLEERNREIKDDIEKYGIAWFGVYKGVKYCPIEGKEM